MRRAILLLTLGIFFTALVVAFLSVYVFHDVDQDKIGHWNEAFADLAIEAVIFSLIISIPTWVLALSGWYLLHLGGYPPRAGVGLALGILVTVCQYPFEFLGRKLVPNLAGLFLSIYLVAGVLLCTAILVVDTRRQKVQRALEADSIRS